VQSEPPAPLEDQAPSRDLTLSIVIVSWNTQQVLRSCLASIFAHPPSSTFETVVVDNGSTDASVATVRADFPQVQVIENGSNLGFSRATNQGIRQTRGRFVLLLNSDTEVQPGVFDRLTRCMETHPRVGACGPMLLHPDGSFQSSHARFPVVWRELLAVMGVARWIWGSTYPSAPYRLSLAPGPVEWVGGACLLIRRACVDQVGCLDEGFPMYSEEVDLCYRMRRHGWDVWYCPEARIIHLGGASSKRVPIYAYVQLHRSKARFLEKHAGRQKANVYWLAFRLSCLLKAAVSRLRGDSDRRPMQQPPRTSWQTYWQAARTGR
jgi:GT2 family glycosyltransferase